MEKWRSQALSNPQLGLHFTFPSCASQLLPVPPEHPRNQRLAVTPLPPLQLPEEQILPCLTHQALLCLPKCWKWYPRRNPLWKPSRGPFSSAVSQKPLAVSVGGLVSAWHCHQHPAPSAHFTGDLPPSWFSEANSNSFRASLRCLSSLHAQPAQEMKQNYYHTLYPEYVYKGLMNY